MWAGACSVLDTDVWWLIQRRTLCEYLRTVTWWETWNRRKPSEDQRTLKKLWTQGFTIRSGLAFSTGLRRSFIAWEEHYYSHWWIKVCLSSSATVPIPIPFTGFFFSRGLLRPTQGRHVLSRYDALLTWDCGIMSMIGGLSLLVFCVSPKLGGLQDSTISPFAYLFIPAWDEIKSSRYWLLIRQASIPPLACSQRTKQEHFMLSKPKYG